MFSTESLDGVGIGRPDGWERIDLPGVGVALGMAGVPEGVFRPNVVVTVRPFAGSVRQLSSLAMAGIVADLEDAQLVSCDRIEHDGVEGRILTFFHTAGTRVLAQRRVFPVNGHAVDVTSSYAASQHSSLRELVDEMLWSLDFGALTAGTAAAAGTAATGHATKGDPDVFVPDREPALEEYVSASSGRPFEKLSHLAGLRPYRADGPVVDDASFKLLRSAAETGGVGRLMLMGHRGAHQKLVAANLMTSGGQLTADGLAVARPLADERARIRLIGQFGDRSTILELFLGEDSCTALAGPGLLGLADPDAGTEFRLDFTDLDHVYSLICDWVGLAPAWGLSPSWDLGPGAGGLTPGMLERRVTDPGTPPPHGSDEHMRHLWGLPWFGWSIESWPGEAYAFYANVFGAGHYTFAGQDGHAYFRPESAASVLSAIAEAVDRARYREGRA